MISRIARPLSIFLFSATLALPLVAQPPPATHEPAPSLLAQLWQQLSAPIVALFATDETDGRGVWDPDGLTAGVPGNTENDGRGVWDPDG